MKRLLQFFLFFLTYTLEVEVHANSAVNLLNQTDPILFPPNCEVASDSCGYKTYPERKFLIKTTRGDFTLGADTIVIRKSDIRFAMVSGRALFVGQEGFIVETPMGSITTLNSKTKFLVEKVDERYLLSVIEGRIEVSGTGSKTPIEILSGYENTLSGVSDKGIAVTGFPKPIVIDSMLPKWASLYNGTKTQFKKELSEFKTPHDAAIEQISDTYLKTANREIASHQLAVQRQIERQKREELERAGLRKMFERRLKGLE